MNSVKAAKETKSTKGNVVVFYWCICLQQWTYVLHQLAFEHAY